MCIYFSIRKLISLSLYQIIEKFILSLDVVYLHRFSLLHNRRVKSGKCTYMEGNIVKHANQLGWKVRVTGYDVSLLLHGSCNLKVMVVKGDFHQQHKYRNNKSRSYNHGLRNILAHYVLEGSKPQDFQQEAMKPKVQHKHAITLN